MISALVEILTPNTKVLDGRVRRTGPAAAPLVVVSPIAAPDVRPEAVRFGDHWFVKGNSDEARLLDRLEQGARA